MDQRRPVLRAFVHNCVVHPLLGLAQLAEAAMEKLHDVTAPPEPGEPQIIWPPPVEVTVAAGESDAVRFAEAVKGRQPSPVLLDHR